MEEDKSTLELQVVVIGQVEAVGGEADSVLKKWISQAEQEGFGSFELEV